jgi:hypothetical protein
MAAIKVDSAQQALEGMAATSFAQRAATQRRPRQSRASWDGHVMGLRERGDKLAEADVGDEAPILERAVGLWVRPAGRLSAIAVAHGGWPVTCRVGCTRRAVSRSRLPAALADGLSCRHTTCISAVCRACLRCNKETAAVCTDPHESQYDQPNTPAAYDYAGGLVYIAKVQAIPSLKTKDEISAASVRGALDYHPLLAIQVSMLLRS